MTLSIRSIIFRVFDRRTQAGKIRRAYLAIDRHERREVELQKFFHFQRALVRGHH